LPPGAAAADPRDEPPQKSDIDEALLKDLDNDLLEGAGDLKNLPAKPARSDSSKAATPEPAPLDGDDVGMPCNEQDPLLHISEEMRAAEGWIPLQNRRVATEAVQERIVEKLARLIQQTEQQQQAQQSSKSSQKQPQSSQRKSAKQSKSGQGGDSQDSNKPAQDSTDRVGQAKPVRPDAETVKSLIKDTWGHLPERDREQVLQHSPEQFLPQYEVMIERYYKRLAEEHRTR
jgi:hypothetical protein